MIRRPPRSTQSRSSAASDVYKRQLTHFSAYGLGMAVAPDSQRRRLPGLELLQTPQRKSPEQLKNCLGSLQRDWRRDDHLAALWQDWPSIAGAHLAPHCRPLALQRGILTVGASHPQWRQALLYNRPQLLSALTRAGHAIRDLRIQQPVSYTHLTLPTIYSV